MKEIKLMASVLLNFLINHIIRVNGFKIKLLEKENLSIPKDKCTRDNGKMTDLSDWACLFLKMEQHMKVSLMKA